MAPEEIAPGWKTDMIAYFKKTENFSTLLIRAIARYLKVNEEAAAEHTQIC